MRTTSLVLAVLSMTVLSACSDDTVKRDGAVRDLSPMREMGKPVEASLRDAAAREAATRDAGVRETGNKNDMTVTVCGTKTCNPSTEICVQKEPVGPGISYDCVAVPAGCETNRTCACVKSTICVGAFSVCTDINTPNTVRCECPNCQ